MNAYRIWAGEESRVGGLGEEGILVAAQMLGIDKIYRKFLRVFTSFVIKSYYDIKTVVTQLNRKTSKKKFEIWVKKSIFP